ESAALAAAEGQIQHSAREAAAARAERWRYLTGNGSWHRTLAAELQEQAALLRDIFGNPFRPVNGASSWTRGNGGAVSAMARAIYEERRFEDLPVLATPWRRRAATTRTSWPIAGRREPTRAGAGWWTWYSTGPDPSFSGRSADADALSGLCAPVL